MKHTNLILLLLAVAFVGGTQNGFAQEKITSPKEVEGKALQIIFKTDKGEYVLEGEKAEQALEKLRSKKQWKFMTNGDSLGNVFFVSTNEEEEMFDEDNGNGIKWFTKSEDGDSSMVKKIDVEVEDGVMKVIVTTKLNGEEKTDVYEGEEAEKYLEESGEGNHVMILRDGDENGFEFWVDEDSEGSEEKEIEKEVKITEENGSKKLVIKTTVNGEETTEEYTGEEAEKKIEELQKEDDDENVIVIKIDKEDGKLKSGKKVKVKLLKDFGGKHKKKVIIKKMIKDEEKEEHDND